MLQGLAPDPPDPPDPPASPGVSSPAPGPSSPPQSHRGPPPPKSPRPSPALLVTPPEQINQLTNPGHPLIKIAGIVAGHPAVALLDCGATGQFVSSRFAQAHGLTVSSASFDTITLADGRSQKAAGVMSSVSVSFGGYADRLDFTLTDLHGYDVILGMPWLVRYNPVVDWRGATVSFVDQHNRSQVLRRIPTGVAPWRDPSSSSSRSSFRSSSSPPSLGLNLITARQLERSQRKGLIEFACLVYPQLVAGEVVPGAAVGSAAVSTSSAFTQQVNQVSSCPRAVSTFRSWACGRPCAIVRRAIDSVPVGIAVLRLPSPL